MKPQLKQKLDSCGTLPTLPGVAMQILELCRSNQVSFGEIAVLVSQDPDLSAKVLQVVNSPFHRMCRDLTTLSHAYGLLGIRAI